jgi:hypothetical protein
MLSGSCLARYRHLSNRPRRRPRPRSRSLNVLAISAIPASKEVENEDEDDWGSTLSALNTYAFGAKQVQFWRTIPAISYSGSPFRFLGTLIAVQNPLFAFDWPHETTPKG